MSENAHFNMIQCILPFSAVSENREEPFSAEMEKTVIFCLAELERTKGGGLVLKQPTEKTVFASKLCYPFFLVPYGKSALLFDGLNTTAHTLSHKPIPSAKDFLENAKRSSRIFEAYTTFLSDNSNYFQALPETKEHSINGLVSDLEFLNEFSLYIEEAKQVETLPSDLAMLQPTLEETTIASTVQELENYRTKFKEEINTFDESIKLLNDTTHNFARAIRSKIKETKEEFDSEIKKQENIVKPKIDSINEEYNEKIAKLAKETEKQILPLQKEKVKHEKNREQTLSKIEHYKTEAKEHAKNKNSVGEKKWKEKANESKRELSEIDAKIKEIGRKINGIEENKTLEIFKLKSERENKIKEAKKDLLELEASRDAKIQLHKQAIEKLEGATTAIVEQLSKMTKLREANLTEFEKLGIEQKQIKHAIIYMPFYIVCYHYDSRKRYVIFPPSAVNSISLLTKLKGALGRAKIKHLLTPRFKAIAVHLYKLPALIERNAVLEREISEAGNRINLLKMDVIAEQTRNSLKQLKEEGWLTEKEHETFSKQLEQIN